MANNGNRKSIFGDFPSDWRQLLVEELVNTGVIEKPLDGNHGSIHPVASDFVAQGIPFIMANSIQDGNLDLKNCIFSRKEQADKLQKGFSRTGDVLLTHKGSVGNTAIVGEISTEYIMLTPQVTYYRIIDQSQLDRRYLRSFFESEAFQGVLKVRSGGGTRAYIGITNQRKLPILLPPLSEQKVIAGVLGLMDGAINQNNQLIAQKELRKKWLMQNLLTGKKRLKGFSGEWKDERLGKLFTHIKDINDGGDAHSVMTISSKLGLISQEDKFDRVIAGDSLKKYTQLKKNDFAYNKGNSKSYPMGCIYQLEEKPSALVPFVYICFSPTKLVDPKFYKHWFLGHGLDRQLKKIITSGARGDGLLNVNVDDFFKLRAVFPPLEEQAAIAQVLQAADREIQLLKTRTEKLREQKKGMMQQLLTGKKRLKIEGV